MPRSPRAKKAAPFKRRLEEVLAVTKASGATRVEIKTQDGASYTIDLTPTAAPEINDFDRPPNPPPGKRGNARDHT
jgi:hypothetical protein